MYSLVLAVLLPCQEPKLDRALFYLVTSDKKLEKIISKSKEDLKENPVITSPVRSRYFYRSSNC